jgi:hypothetical protein
MHHVRGMISLRIEGARKLQHVRRTKLHAKATSFAALNDDRNTSFCHENPQLGVTTSGVSTAENVIMRKKDRETV